MSFLVEYNKYIWSRWTYNSNIGIIALRFSGIPGNHGVYIIKSSKDIDRVKGKSDIIYIGQSGGGEKGGKQGIGPGPGGNPVGRLFNTRGGAEDWVKKKIESMFPNSSFTLECYFTKSTQDPKKIECELLKAYAEEHFELPPANHQSFKI